MKTHQSINKKNKPLKKTNNLSINIKIVNEIPITYQ